MRSDKIWIKNYGTICILYRAVSLAISTAAFLLLPSDKSFASRIVVASGMVLANIISCLIYNKNTVPVAVYLTIALEILAYGIFTIIAGGFASIYLWYYFSVFLVAAAVSMPAWLMVMALVWWAACALAGYWVANPQGRFSVADINMIISFVIVAGGFYLLFGYTQRLKEQQERLQELNGQLEKEKERSEEAFRYTMELYDAFNLFSITDPDVVLQTFVEALHRSVAPGGCLLIRISALEIQGIYDCGLNERESQCIVNRIRSMLGAGGPIDTQIHAGDAVFTVRRVGDEYNPAGILVLPPRTKTEYAGGISPQTQLSFYENVLSMLLKELELQETLELYIVSEEQNRIASEIHDTVIQKLFAIVCNIHILEDKLHTLEEKQLQSHLDVIGKSIENTMAELRKTIYGLRWDADGHDLFSAKLTEYAEEMSELTGTDIRMEIGEGSHCLNIKQKTSLYRGICEAINNAIRHGKAGLIQVSLRIGEDGILAVVKDDGEGFFVPDITRSGQGLRNMHRMMYLLKGRLSIQSELGHGSTISFYLPQMMQKEEYAV